MSHSLQALLFDVDGTLAETERDGHRIAFNRAFAEAGLDWEWGVSLYGELLRVSGGKERLRWYIEKWQPGFSSRGDLDGLVRDLHARKTEYYIELAGSGSIPLRPGVERLLTEAREAGLRLGLVTTSAPESVTALLETSMGRASPDWFDVIAAGDVVPAKKPAPDVYHYALRRLVLPATACIAFEDSDNGLASATAAGVTTLVTVNDYTRDQDFTGAVLVVDQLGEPGAGFRVLAGDARGKTWVDVDLLRQLPGRPPGRLQQDT
jgi:HAD superfamily hydrolase (TIGR01509 family)